MTLRILFVEKDLTTADLLVPSLERKGFQLTLAHTQRQATRRVRASLPDLLIMDVASFGPRGYRISDAIRARLPGVPTILLLAEGHGVAGSSAEAFMTPPFTSRRLLYRVRKVAETLPSREIIAGDLALDPDRGILHKGETEMHLRPKESALLALFLRNRGKVLRRREIMEKVWRTDYLEDTRTLNVHVCSGLRSRTNPAHRATCAQFAVWAIALTCRDQAPGRRHGPVILKQREMHNSSRAALSHSVQQDSPFFPLVL
jgi:DNA-binding response OmpR family regulator